jgi:hypothetical protein
VNPFLRRENPFHHQSNSIIDHGTCAIFGSLDPVFIGRTVFILAYQGFTAAYLASSGLSARWRNLTKKSEKRLELNLLWRYNPSCVKYVPSYKDVGGVSASY